MTPGTSPHFYGRGINRMKERQYTFLFEGPGGLRFYIPKNKKGELLPSHMSDNGRIVLNKQLVIENWKDERNRIMDKLKS